MSKKQVIVHELESVPEKDLDALLGFIHSLKARNAEGAASAPGRVLSDEGLALARGGGSLGRFVSFCQITSQAKSGQAGTL